MFDNDNTFSNWDSVMQSKQTLPSLKGQSFGTSHHNADFISKRRSPSNLSSDSQVYSIDQSEKLYYRDCKGDRNRMTYFDDEENGTRDVRVSYIESRTPTTVKKQESVSDIIVWGNNAQGQIGLQNISSVKIPYSIRQDQFKIKQIACGRAHSAILTDKGQIYMMGSNTSGQLGLGIQNLNFQNSPQLIETLSAYEAKKICCAEKSTFVLLNSGELYAWGSNKHGILGVGDCIQDSNVPVKTLVEEQDSLYIIDINAGKNHCGLIAKKMDNNNSSSNYFYMWGSNKYGQLGLGDFENKTKPAQVDLNFNPMDFDCGFNFTLIQDFMNNLYSCGNNKNHELGIPDLDNSSCNQFQQLESFSNDPIVKLACSSFASCLDSSGNYFIWGPTPLENFNQPQRVQDLTEQQLIVKDIGQGKSFSVFTDQDGQVYQLGYLPSDDQNSSEIIKQICGLSLNILSCGYDFVVGYGTETSEVHKSLTKSQTMGDFKLSQNSVSYKKKRTPSVANQTLSTSSFNLQNMIQFQTQDCSANPTPTRQRSLQENYNKEAAKRNLAIQMISREFKHQDACTPIRDRTPPPNTSMKRDKTPSSTSNLKLRIPSNQLDPSCSGSNNLESLNRTLNITPQQLRKPLGGTQQLPNNMGFNATPSQVSPYMNPHMQMNPTLNQSQAFFSSSIYQSLDNQFQNNTFNVNNSYVGNHMYTHYDLVIKEKQDLQHQLNIEVQRRLMLEKEIGDMYRQLDSLKTGPGGIFDLSRQLEISKMDYANLLAEREEDSDESIDLKFQLKDKDCKISELQCLLQEHQMKFQQLLKENEFLRTRVDLDLRHSVAIDKDPAKTKELEDQMIKKNKELYDLTVQLGCLKEENFQYKKDQEELRLDFSERLRDQQQRAEEDYLRLQTDNEELRTAIEQYKEIGKEVKSLKIKQEQKSLQLSQAHEELERKMIEIEERDDVIQNLRQEIKSLQAVQDNLVTEIRSLQEVVKGVEQRNQQLLDSLQVTKITKRTIDEKQQLVIDKELDIDDIKKAAIELLKEEVFTGRGCERMEKTHKFNPIETPLDSERGTKDLKREKTFNQTKAGSRTSNRDQGCLQMIANPSNRRKSLNGCYNQVLKTQRTAQQPLKPLKSTNLQGTSSRPQSIGDSKTLAKSVLQSKSKSPLSKKKLHETMVMDHENEMPLKMDCEPQRSPNYQTNPNNKSGAMVDMRHKLSDIQTNKMFLEKKIQEYERKLNELKGGQQLKSLGEELPQTKGLNKNNTMSASIFEKVLSESRR